MRKVGRAVPDLTGRSCRWTPCSELGSISSGIAVASARLRSGSRRDRRHSRCRASPTGSASVGLASRRTRRGPPRDLQGKPHLSAITGWLPPGTAWGRPSSGRAPRSDVGYVLARPVGRHGAPLPPRGRSGLARPPHVSSRRPSYPPEPRGRARQGRDDGRAHVPGDDSRRPFDLYYRRRCPRNRTFATTRDRVSHQSTS